MVEIIEEASEEIDEAFEWYLKRSVRAASEFRNRLKDALTRIDSSPKLGTLFIDDAYWYRVQEVSLPPDLSDTITHDSSDRSSASKPTSRFLDETAVAFHVGTRQSLTPRSTESFSPG
jgi:hypothetical protein